jgi:predicted regulator of Ras-like GTPase activity (Roadblock/LC7/MglB family)
MGLKGNLRDMTVADLIQHQCADRKTAKVTIVNSSRTALIFFKGGEVVHAQLDKNEGEEVVFEILRWEEGTFAVEAAIDPPKVTIDRSWSGLLMEGAKRIDEETHESDKQKSIQAGMQEVKGMATRIDEILQEMSGEMNGFFASSVTGMDGMSIAQLTKGKVDPEIVSAQLAVFLKLASSSSDKAGMGDMEDLLIQTADHFVMNVFLPGDNQHFLTTIVDRKNGSIGNLRMVSKIYAERISKAIPR